MKIFNSTKTIFYYLLLISFFTFNACSSDDGEKAEEEEIVKDPVNAIDPTKPTDPTNPTDPTDPTNPTPPTTPSTPTYPYENAIAVLEDTYVVGALSLEKDVAVRGLHKELKAGPTPKSATSSYYLHYKTFLKFNTGTTIKKPVKSAIIRLVIKDASKNVKAVGNITAIKSNWNEKNTSRKSKVQLHQTVRRANFNWNNSQLKKDSIVEIDVTKVLNSIYTKKLSFYGFSLFATLESEAITFYASNVADITKKPTIYIEYED